VGNDTGPLHLAVAVGTPVVSLFGPSRTEMYRPYDARSVALCYRERCHGCTFRGGLVERCLHNFSCLRAISVADVWEEIERRLPVRST
jgi:ADP-heptose:LPS heptosyltransferase